MWYSEHPYIFVNIPKNKSVSAAENMAQTISAINKKIKAMISISQECYKEQADKHRLPDLIFAVGNKAWLSHIHIQTDWLVEKLDFRKLGPYQIIEKLPHNAYQLKFLASMHIHNVFNVGRLEKYIKDTFGRTPTLLPPIITANDKEE